MYDYKEYNPFWVHSPTLHNIKQLLFETNYPRWLMITMGDRGRLDLPVAVRPACWPPMRSSGCASRARSMSAWRSTWPIWCRRRSCSFRWRRLIFQFGLFDNPLALILTYPTFLVPFCTWLLIGYFKSIPYELEECALIDGASRLQILRRITLPLAVPGLISAGIFAFTLSWNEFIYALAFIQSDRQEDRAGGDPDRTGDRRRLSVGLADGRLAAGLGAGGDCSTRSSSSTTSRR